MYKVEYLSWAGYNTESCDWHFPINNLIFLILCLCKTCFILSNEYDSLQFLFNNVVSVCEKRFYFTLQVRYKTEQLKVKFPICVTILLIT